MSAPAPSGTRRRIAGERRRGARVEGPEAGPTPAGAGSGPAGPEARPAPTRDPESPPRTSRIRFLVALLLALVTVTAAAWLGLRTWDFSEVRRQQRVEAAGIAASRAAAEAAEAVLSYRHDTLDENLRTATRYLTPAFAEEYTATFEDYVRPAAPGLRAEVTATTLASAVVRAQEDRAQILVYVDQTTLTSTNPRGAVALNRVTFDLHLVDGRWLVSGYDAH